MTEIRFELKSIHLKKFNFIIYDNLTEKELNLSIFEVVDLLNEVSQSEYTLHTLKEDIIKKLDKISDVEWD